MTYLDVSRCGISIFPRSGVRRVGSSTINKTDDTMGFFGFLFSQTRAQQDQWSIRLFRTQLSIFTPQHKPTSKALKTCYNITVDRSQQIEFLLKRGNRSCRLRQQLQAKIAGVCWIY